MDSSERLRRTEAEREYLLLWLGGITPALRGLSADALTLVAFRGGRPHSYPRDKGDLGRCERAFNAMPAHLQDRARPLLEAWRAEVRQRGEA